MTKRQILLAVGAGLIAAGILLAFVVPSWIFHPLGVCTGDNCGYQFWSGIAGSFLIGGGLWSGALGLYWHHTCGAPGCLRIGKHPTADGQHHLCPRHHPDHPDDRKRTLAEIHEAHHAAKRNPLAGLDDDLRHLADLPPSTEARQFARRLGERLNGGER